MYIWAGTFEAAQREMQPQMQTEFALRPNPYRITPRSFKKPVGKGLPIFAGGI